MAVNALLYPDTSRFFGRLAEKVNNWGIRKGILISPFTQGQVRDMLAETGFLIAREEVSGNSYSVLVRKPAA